MDGQTTQIVIAGVTIGNFFTLLGLIGKVWAWSHRMENRMSVLETNVKILLRREEARLWYMQGVTKGGDKDV